MSNDRTKKYHLKTALGHAGRAPHEHEGTVNTPLYRASTILYDTIEQYRANQNGKPVTKNSYGLSGTATTRAVEEVAAVIEGGNCAVSVPSGLIAVTGALLSVVKSGDHILITDNVYRPTRRYADHYLSRFGVEAEYFDPTNIEDLQGRIRAETRVIFLESPGTHTFEITDIPAITAIAKRRGITTIMDNTWSAGVYFKPFDHGVDISVQAATKYFCGHSDVLLGFIITDDMALGQRVRDSVRHLGVCAGADDCYLGLRGARTLMARLPQHYETGLALAQYLANRKEVKAVLHPALPSFPNHEIWKRDFTGASGLFGVVFHDFSDAAFSAMINGMELYGLGDSWGGYESLLIPTTPAKTRTVMTWPHNGPSIRIHAGLEHVDDLIKDLETALKRLVNTL